MPLLQVIVLALVQGLTEFLPISSTAHLYLTSWLFGWQVEGLDFDIALHIGTLLAVLLYFARDWVQIIAQGFGIRMRGDEELKHNHMLLWLLVIGTIPVGIAGLVFNKQAETTWRNPFVIGGMLIAVGVLMYLAENAGRQQRDLSSINLPDAVTIGAAQALAVVPGTSRSGITISAGLFRNMTRESAARFSFLLSTPAIGAAAAKALLRHAQEGRPARRSEYRLSGGRGGQRHHRLPRDLLVSALFASRRLAAVRVLPHCFWHNSACSGFHPPASVMKLLSPTQHRRLNEIVGFLLLSLGLVMLLSLVSYHTQDPSFDTAAASRPLNLVGYPGSYLSDLFFQMFGAAAFLFPLLTFLLSWKWIRSEELEAGGVKIFGSILLTLALSAGLSFAPLRLFAGTIRIGGTLGLTLANYLVDSLNVIGALVITLTAIVISVYLVSTFTLATLAGWLAGPSAWFAARAEAWREWRERAHQRAVEKAKAKAAARARSGSRGEAAQGRGTRAGARRREWRRCLRTWMAARRGRPARRRNPRNMPAWKSPRRGPEPTPPSKRFPSVRWKNWRPCRTCSPPCCPPRTRARTLHAHRPGLPPAAHRPAQRGPRRAILTTSRN